jgi:hypothetical protein
MPFSRRFYNLLQWCHHFVADLSAGEWVNVTRPSIVRYGSLFLRACLCTEEHVTWFQKKDTFNFFMLGAFIKVSGSSCNVVSRLLRTQHIYTWDINHLKLSLVGVTI